MITKFASPAELLCELISIPSVSPMGREVSDPIYFEHRLSDWLQAYFQQLGADCERIEVLPGRDNILAYYDAGSGRPTVLWDAHQDTVPIEGMTIDPFVAKRDAGKIYGRGAADVKGSMAAMLHAFARLRLMVPAIAVPPVMLDTHSGALSVFPPIRLGGMTPAAGWPDNIGS